jgi:hypothetical protein
MSREDGPVKTLNLGTVCKLALGYVELSKGRD